MPHIIEITDLSAPELDVFARLTEAQLRSRRAPERALFIAESPKVIGHALDAGYEPVSLLMERRFLSWKEKLHINDKSTGWRAPPGTFSPAAGTCPSTLPAGTPWPP